MYVAIDRKPDNGCENHNSCDAQSKNNAALKHHQTVEQNLSSLILQAGQNIQADSSKILYGKKCDGSPQ